MYAWNRSENVYLSHPWTKEKVSTKQNYSSIGLPFHKNTYYFYSIFSLKPSQTKRKIPSKFQLSLFGSKSTQRRLAKVITPKTAHLTDHADFVSITQIMAHLQNLKIINFLKPIFLRQKSILSKSGDDKLLEIDYIYYII